MQHEAPQSLILSQSFNTFKFQLHRRATDRSWKEKYLEIGVYVSTNSTCSQDEWARPPHADYVILIPAYIKASAETESLTTPSV